MVRNLLSLKCWTLMTFTTCSFRPVLPGWPHASSHHLEVLALRNLRFQNLLLENNLQTFPLFLQLFFPPHLAHGLPCYLQPHWRALPCSLYPMLTSLESPHSHPPKLRVPWLGDFAHAVIQLLNKYLLNYSSVRIPLLAPLPGTSVSSQPPLLLVSPTHHFKHSLEDTSSKKRLLTIPSIPLFSFCHAKSRAP